ncbi:YqgE/AlgH family protein [Thalassospira sp.]|uniref:YqgE/AlgH family protein n=1 Tax=Thalassospira sp. TaxID=1912094 RepID=UPI002733C45D|nr:YqgE/AlgH family protein [Thalassospira sp.]MDP2698780.1 YqgE/AlgH family protein [Thalassospira sp.]
MGEHHSDAEYLDGKLLIAMPGMRDPRFSHSVVYLCAHNEDGAMGLVVNRLIDSITFSDLLDQLGIARPAPTIADVQVHFGGPVESGRGFVLHTADFASDATLEVDAGISVTATVDILQSIALGKGPAHSILALGYAGWRSGQLESEIRANGWLHVDADIDLLFDMDCDDKWQRAFAKLGFSPELLSGEAGHA